MLRRPQNNLFDSSKVPAQYRQQSFEDGGASAPNSGQHSLLLFTGRWWPELQHGSEFFLHCAVLCERFGCGLTGDNVRGLALHGRGKYLMKAHQCLKTQRTGKSFPLPLVPPLTPVLEDSVPFITFPLKHVQLRLQHDLGRRC